MLMQRVAHDRRRLGCPRSLGRRMDLRYVSGTNRLHARSRGEHRDDFAARTWEMTCINSGRPGEEVAIPEKLGMALGLLQGHEHAVRQVVYGRPEGPLGAAGADPLQMETLVDRRRRGPCR